MEKRNAIECEQLKSFPLLLFIVIPICKISKTSALKPHGSIRTPLFRSLDDIHSLEAARYCNDKAADIWLSNMQSKVKNLIPEGVP